MNVNLNRPMKGEKIWIDPVYFFFDPLTYPIREHTAMDQSESKNGTNQVTHWNKSITAKSRMKRNLNGLIRGERICVFSDEDRNRKPYLFFFFFFNKLNIIIQEVEPIRIPNVPPKIPQKNLLKISNF